jgi:nickel-dependent lactate racemase
MNVELWVGDTRYEAPLDLPEAQVFTGVAKPGQQVAMEQAVTDALESPIGAAPLRSQRLAGKRIAIMVDDAARPTPAYRLVPPLLRELTEAGVKQDDICFVTGTGLHMPMDRDQLITKLGEEIVRSYPVFAHDAFAEDLVHMGFSMFGNPIWMNRHVAEADYRIAVGRIAVHMTFGYEGGAKMIVPGVAGWVTVMRNHSMTFAEETGVGHHNMNPGRWDAVSVASLVGLDFILNIVTDRAGNCYGAVAGHFVRAHHRGIEFGDRNVWALKLPWLADIVIASPGRQSPAAFDSWSLYHAECAIRRGATIVIAGSGDAPVSPQGDGLGYEQTIFEHERRNHALGTPEAIRYIKKIRGGYFVHRACARNNVLYVNEKEQPSLTDTYGITQYRSLSSALEAALTTHGGSARVVCLPEANTTLPLLKLHEAGDMDRRLSFLHEPSKTGERVFVLT